MKLFFRNLLVRTARLLGSTLRDAESGRPIGRALIVPWRGQIHLIGLEDQPVIPVFRREKRLTYWRQTLVFVTHPPPDYPRLHSDSENG